MVTGGLGCSRTILMLQLAPPPSLPPTSRSSILPSPHALSFDWSTSTTLNSDHLPMSLSFSDDSTLIRAAKSFTNFRKADWEGFRRESEDLFCRLPPPKLCAMQSLAEMLRLAHSCWLSPDLLSGLRRYFIANCRGFHGKLTLLIGLNKRLPFCLMPNIEATSSAAAGNKRLKLFDR